MFTSEHLRRNDGTMKALTGCDLLSNKYVLFTWFHLSTTGLKTWLQVNLISLVNNRLRHFYSGNGRFKSWFISSGMGARYHANLLRYLCNDLWQRNLCKHTSRGPEDGGSSTWPLLGCRHRSVTYSQPSHTDYGGQRSSQERRGTWLAQKAFQKNLSAIFIHQCAIWCFFQGSRTVCSRRSIAATLLHTSLYGARITYSCYLLFGKRRLCHIYLIPTPTCAVSHQ